MPSIPFPTIAPVRASSGVIPQLVRGAEQFSFFFQGLCNQKEMTRVERDGPGGAPARSQSKGRSEHFALFKIKNKIRRLGRMV